MELHVSLVFCMFQIQVDSYKFFLSSITALFEVFECYDVTFCLIYLTVNTK
jgi:hypothetical protein